MNDFDLFTKRASKELERILNIEPYSDDLVVPLGSWKANHNREAMENFIRSHRKVITEFEGNFEGIMTLLTNLLKEAFIAI